MWCVEGVEASVEVVLMFCVEVSRPGLRCSLTRYSCTVLHFETRPMQLIKLREMPDADLTFGHIWNP